MRISKIFDLFQTTITILHSRRLINHAFNAGSSLINYRVRRNVVLETVNVKEGRHTCVSRILSFKFLGRKPESPFRGRFNGASNVAECCGWSTRAGRTLRVQVTGSMES